MIREARCQGSVTVFFALTLTLILAVICTTLESARYSLLSYFASQAQGAAVESVFAGYYRPLWENYHLLFMADSAGLEAMVEKELAKAGERAGSYGFQVGSVQAVRTVTAVDQEAPPSSARCERTGRPTAFPPFWNPCQTRRRS